LAKRQKSKKTLFDGNGGTKMAGRKMTIRMICLIVAATVLTGTLAVSAFNGSPYETLKTALFDAAALENFTLEGEFTLRLNGEVYEQEYINMSRGNGRELNLSQSSGFNFSTITPEGGLIVRSEGKLDGVEWYSVAPTWSRTSSFGGGLITMEERQSNEFRLMELALDLVIGDLKNNITMASQGNGIRRVSGAVTGNQLPEIIRVAIDVFIEQELNSRSRWREGDFGQREDYRSILDIPPRSLTIDLIQGVADIDADGNLLYLNANATVTITNVFNDTYVLDIEGVVRLSDIGTSNPQIPIPGAEALFTAGSLDYLLETRFPDILYNVRHRNIIFFTLDDDGYVDQESFTMTRPPGLSWW